LKKKLPWAKYPPFAHGGQFLPSNSQKQRFFIKFQMALKCLKMIFFCMGVVSFESSDLVENFWPWKFFSYDK
jgi:hypothetical protein